MDFPINIDPSSPKPLHRQIYDEIRKSILDGRIVAGEKVPSTRELAKALSVSRATVTLSYDCLLSEGYFKAVVGSGTFVSSELPEDLLRPSRDGEGALAGSNPLSSDVMHYHASTGTKAGATARITTTGDAGGAAQPKRNDGKAAMHQAGHRLSWFGESLRAREWLQFPEQEPPIQLMFGRPDLEEFPMRTWNQLLLHHARKRKLELLDSPANARGYGPLREQIAAYVGRSRAVRCDASQVIIVNGSQQAIDLVTRVLVDRGDRVLIEEPGYIGAQKALQAQGADILPVPVDAHGLVVEWLKNKELSQPLPPKLIYVTPSHQSPTGSVLSLPRRLELINWARKMGAYIIEDDYDSEYRYTGRPIPALAGFEHANSVIYIGTFSKVLLPALRLGYLVVPDDLVEVFTRAKWLCDRHSPLLEQQALCDFIRLGHLERHIRRMRRVYEKKRLRVVESLRSLLGNAVTVFGDNAGINVLVRVASAKSSEEIVEQARRLGVGVASTAPFYLGSAPEGEFLLNYGALSDEQIDEGLKLFSQAVRA